MLSATVVLSLPSAEHPTAVTVGALSGEPRLIYDDQVVVLLVDGTVYPLATRAAVRADASLNARIDEARSLVAQAIALCAAEAHAPTAEPPYSLFQLACLREHIEAAFIECMQLPLNRSWRTALAKARDALWALDTIEFDVNTSTVRMPSSSGRGWYDAGLSCSCKGASYTGICYHRAAAILLARAWRMVSDRWDARTGAGVWALAATAEEHVHA